jgi:hypothetical protein
VEEMGPMGCARHWASKNQAHAPRIDGMVERFNGRIVDAVRSHRLRSRLDLEQTLLRYVTLYNLQSPQLALRSMTPIQTVKEWCATDQRLFDTCPYDRPGGHRDRAANATASPQALPNAKNLPCTFPFNSKPKTPPSLWS